jgi:hypothetical protein
MQGEMFTDAKAASYTSAEAMTRSDLMHRCRLLPGCTYVSTHQIADCSPIKPSAFQQHSVLRCEFDLVTAGQNRARG